MKDFSKMKLMIEKKDIKGIKFLLEEYKKENSIRLKTWEEIGTGSLLSFQGYYFLKNHGFTLYGKIFPELLFVLYAINKIIDDINQILNKKNIDFNLIKKSVLEFENLESRFDKLSLKFKVLYRFMGSIVGAYHFYKQNKAVTLHFLERLEKQFNLSRLDSLSESELRVISERIKEIAENYLNKAMESNNKV